MLKDLEVMNSTNPELNWNVVTKGRRSRKTVARNLNDSAKIDNCISPKRVGDFSGSDYDKVGHLNLGPLTSGKSKSVPPKKRKHFAQSSPLYPLASSLCVQDSASQRTGSSSPFSGDHEQLYPSSGQRSSNRNKRRVQGPAKIDSVFALAHASLYDQDCNGIEDFSGIELLAAAASMGDTDHQEDSLMPKHTDSFNYATLSNICLKNESENSSSNTNVHGINAGCSQEKISASASTSHCVMPEDENVLKVNREHWDLNTQIDAWENPFDDSVAGDTVNEGICSEAVIESSTASKLCHSSGVLLSENKDYISHSVGIIQDEDCSSILARECNAHDIGAPETLIDVQRKETQEFPGMLMRDAQSSPIADLNKKNDLVKHEDSNPHEDSNHRGSKRDIMDDTFMSCAGDLAIDGRCDSAILVDNKPHLVDGDDLACFQDGCDSPFEDGELRGSFLCSWEDNEIENECVHYESDGRNGDGSDAADFPASEIVEGGSEASQDTRRSLSEKISTEGKSKTSQQLMKHVAKDNLDNNKVAGMASNAGSGTTVEQNMEMIMEADDGMKISRLIDPREAVNVRETNIHEYASKMTSKGKIPSEGRSSANSMDEKDGFFVQDFRRRRFGGSHSQFERDASSRYRSNIHAERDGIHQWTSWGSKSRYNSSNYQARPRSKIGESADNIDGLDFHDSSQMGNYMSRGLHRPLMRRSPIERDEYFVGRRIPPITKGVIKYRSRGHYSQRESGRDLTENFEPMPIDVDTSVRMPPYFSRREQSFSLGKRVPHIALSHIRSRSRSREHSPREWHFSKERMLGGIRRNSRSPESRMERVRLPFSNPDFSSDYIDDYMSPPPRGRFSRRWVNERAFLDNSGRRRRSPPPSARASRRPQRFDGVGSSGRVKSDEYVRPVARPRKFSFMGKMDVDCEDRRRGVGGETMHNDDCGNMRRFRHNVRTDNFETTNKKCNNEDGTRVYESSGDGVEKEDKRAINI